LATPAIAVDAARHEASEARRVIFASSLGTVFEWYDFYIYATLAPFFAALFFPSGNATAALLASFACRLAPRKNPGRTLTPPDVQKGGRIRARVAESTDLT